MTHVCVGLQNHEGTMDVSTAIATAKQDMYFTHFAIGKYRS